MQSARRGYRGHANRELQTGICALVSALLAVGGCGGGGGGSDKTTGPSQVGVATVVVAPSSASITVGATQQLSATPQSSAGTALTGRTVSWSTSDASKATVSSSGMVTAVAIGSVTVVATCEGVAGSAAISVVAGTATALAIRTQPSGATAGVAFTVQPVIELRDARGAVASGSSATVTASLASGTGTLIGSTSVASVNGVATFTDLGISGTPGARVLSFSAPGLTAVQSSSVNVVVGAAVALAFTTAPSATSLVTVSLATQPVVQAVDAGGNAVAFAGTVTAAVDSGAGTVMTGGSVNTDAAGKATFATLTLGSASGGTGTSRVRFSAPGLNAAIARIALSCYSQPISLGSLVSSTMSANDCAFTSGSLVRYYPLTRAAALTHARMTVNSAFRPSAYFRGPNSPAWYWGESAASGGTSIAIDMLLPSGMSIMAVRTAAPGLTGTYNVRLDSLNGDVQCTTTYIGGSLSTTQQLGNGDCLSNNYYGDYYDTGWVTGATLIVTAQTNAFVPYVSIWKYGSPNVRVIYDSGITTANVSYTNTGDNGNYYIYVGSQNAGSTGSYVVAFVWTYPSASELLLEQILHPRLEATNRASVGADTRAAAAPSLRGDDRQRP